MAICLLLASWSATAGCVEDMRQKTTATGGVPDEQIVMALETWCTIAEQDATVIDAVEFHQDEINSSINTDWRRNVTLKLGGKTTATPDMTRFVIAHEYAHDELNHGGLRLLRNFAVFIIGFFLVISPFLLIVFKKYRWILPVLVVGLPVHMAAFWYEYVHYLENEHEADIEAIRLLLRHEMPAASAAKAIFESGIVEPEPSFKIAYIRRLKFESLHDQNPHPSTASRMKRVLEELARI